MATLIYNNLLASTGVNVGNSSSPMYCSANKWFWVSWTNTVLQFGRGNQTGNDTLLVFYDHAPTIINYVGVSVYSTPAMLTNWTIPGEFYTTS